MISNHRLLRGLPLRGLRAHVGTKSGSRGGATGLVDLEPSVGFEAVNAVPEEIGARWDAHELVPMCFDNIVAGVREELRALLGHLPAVRVVVREVLPHPVEANEMNNRVVGRSIVHEAFKQLATPHWLRTTEADLTYEVHGPLPTTDDRPPLFLIGHPPDHRGFAVLAAAMVDRTVVMYDPRGVGRSVRFDRRSDHRPNLQAADLHAIIQKLGPVEMVANDHGAIAALALVAAHPEDVTTLVAYEPPLLSVLPDADAIRRARGAVRNTYGPRGFGPAMAMHLVLAQARGEVTDDFAWPGLDDRGRGMPPIDDRKRDHPLLSGNSWPLDDYEPDIEALNDAPTRVVIAMSEPSRDTIAGRSSVALAALLGQEPTPFPEQPENLLGFYFRHDGDPAVFAARLREVLA